MDSGQFKQNVFLKPLILAMIFLYFNVKTA